MNVVLSQKNTERFSDAKEVLQILGQNLFDAAIVGGFCRDAVLGLDAKDVDIVVYNWHKNDVAEQTLCNLAQEQIENAGFRFHEFETYEDADDDDFISRQIRKVWKLNRNGFEIDVIFIEDCHSNPTGAYARFNYGMRRATLESVLYDFDCVINRFFWNAKTDEFQYIDAGIDIDQAMMEIIKFVKVFSIRGNVSPERCQKMFDRFVRFRRAFDTDLQGLVNAFTVKEIKEEDEDE